MKAERLREWVRKIVKFLPLFFYAAFLLFVWTQRDALTLDMLVSFTPKQPVLACLFLLVAFACKSISVFVAIHLLYALGAVLFPFPIALLVNLAGTVIAATVPYLIGRRRGNSYVKLVDKQNHTFTRRVRMSMQQHPLKAVAMLRLLGVFPCDLISMYFGASQMAYGPYLAGSIVGFAPALYAYTVMAEFIDRPASFMFLSAVGVTVVSVLVSIAMGIRMYVQQTKQEMQQTDAEDMKR
jgi:uncharacterized membrane protein YdjX (TVP38/TMEM64 family)